WQRGGQQQRLPFRRAAAEDLLDVGAEPDVEHPVGFVEHDDLHRVELEGPAVDEIDDPPRRADGNLHTPFEVLQLLADGPAADEDRRADVLVRGEAAGFDGHLLAQFAGGREDEGLRLPAVEVDLLENRQDEGGRFSGAGASLAGAVDAPQGDGDESRLNGARGFVADFFENSESRFAEAEVLKGDLRRLGMSVHGVFRYWHRVLFRVIAAGRLPENQAG